MNIMLMSVTERTREIGIRQGAGRGRAATSGGVFRRALTLSVLGGIAGLLVGFALAGLVEANFARPHESHVSIGLALSSALRWVGFGVYPAHRASRLDPIEALRRSR